MSKFLGSLATDVYGIQTGGGDVQSFIPRNKFQFSVQIQHLGTRGELVTFPPPRQMDNGYVAGLRVASIGMPGFTPKTNTLNQYNRKRIVHTGVDYIPIEMVAYDTRDGELERFLKTYTKYYFKGPMNDPLGQSFNSSDIPSDGFISGSSAYGFKLQQDKNFIKQIIITRKSSEDDYNQISIYNPVITSVAADGLNYSESAPMQYTISFAYEGYDIDTFSEL
jgi:hypothetical protein